MTDPTPNAQRPTLLLVDGSSYLYRAFFAGGESLSVTLADGTEQKTGAIRIMINMLQKLQKEFPSIYAACVFDAKGSTFCDTLYPRYKAQRTRMPYDLRSQIGPIREVVRLMGWPVLDVPGVEADDVIGTLAVAASRQGMRVIVSSGDIDLTQLVNDDITIIDTMSGKVRDQAGVLAEFGVPASLMVDIQVLVGHSLRNVPGVNRLSPETAAKWLMKYSSLQGVIDNADYIKGVTGKNLRNVLQQLPNWKELLTIKMECDLSGWVDGLSALESIRFGLPQNDALEIFFSLYHLGRINNPVLNNSRSFRRSPSPINISDPNKEYVVYRIRNLINGSIYFGSSSSVTARWADHKRMLKKEGHHNEGLCRDARVYGENNFEFKVLSKHQNHEKMRCCEQLYISMFWGRKNCYNREKFVVMLEGPKVANFFIVEHDDFRKRSDRKKRILQAEATILKGYGNYLSVHAISRDLSITKARIKEVVDVVGKTVDGWRIWTLVVDKPHDA
jgi:5'-3' exonuclease